MYTASADAATTTTAATVAKLPFGKYQNKEGMSNPLLIMTG